MISCGTEYVGSGTIWLTSAPVTYQTSWVSLDSTRKYGSVFWARWSVFVEQQVPTFYVQLQRWIGVLLEVAAVLVTRSLGDQDLMKV